LPYGSELFHGSSHCSGDIAGQVSYEDGREFDQGCGDTCANLSDRGTKSGVEVAAKGDHVELASWIGLQRLDKGQLDAEVGPAAREKTDPHIRSFHWSM
jgi:hypothetical protein